MTALREVLLLALAFAAGYYAAARATRIAIEAARRGTEWPTD